MASLTRKLLNRAPVAYARSIGLPLFGVRNDAETQMRAYGSVSTLYSIISRITDAVGQVEWHLYREQTDRRRVTATEEEPQRQEVIRHAALNVWNTPNPFMDREELITVGQQHLDTTGEATLVAVRAEGFNIPIELWPVRPDRMIPVPHPTEFLTGWIYQGPGGEQVSLGVDEVIQIKYPNPLDPYRGLGPVQAMMVDLDSARFGAEWNRNFFLNSAEPGGHLETPNNLTDGEWRDLQDRWREQHQGVHNAHRVAVLEAGLTWKQRQITAKDMQFKELRDLSREVIREAFGMHAHMLGITEDVNKANAQEGERSFARWLAMPRARRWKRALNRKLLPMFGTTGQGVLFDHDRIVPEDREADDRERLSKAEAAKFLNEAGVYDPGGILEAVGLPAITTKQPQPTDEPEQANAQL